MPSYIQLPNGKYMEFSDKLDDQQALELAQKKFPKLYGEEGEKGILSGAKRSAESMLSSGVAGIESLISDPTKAAQRALKRSEAQQQFYEEQTGLDLVKKAYEDAGLWGGAKEVMRQAPLAAAEFAPQIATSLGAARIGATGGAMVGGLPGAVIGGAVGAFAPSFLQQLGGNVERQVAEQREAGKPQAVDLGAAVPAAAGQGMLDMAGNFIPFGKGAVRMALGKEGVQGLENVFGKRVATMLAKDDLQGAKKLLNESWKATVAKGTATGILAEVPTEVAQQVLERGQAGLDIMNGDALNEYLDTAYQMALISPFGIAGRYSDKASAGKAREERYAALTGARAERAQTRFEEEQAKFQASAGYLTQLEEAAAKEQAAIDKMQASLDSGKVKKPEKLQDKIADKQAKIASIQEQIAAHPLSQSAAQQAQAEQLAQLQAEETGAPADIEQQRQAALAANEEQRKQQSLAQGLGQQMGIPGAEPVVGPAAPPPVADQRAELDNQTKSLSAELAKINARIEAQQKELAAAAAAGDTTKAMELMAQAEKDKTPAYKAEIEKQLKAAQAQAAELKKADPAEQLKALQKQFVKAGDEGNFEAIKVLAPQIEALKQQVPAEPAAEKPVVQQSFFGKEGEPTLFAEQAVARREKEITKENKPLIAAAKAEAGVRGEALASEEADLLAEQAAAPEATPQTGLFTTLANVASPQGRPEPSAGAKSVLGRPAQPLGFEKANERVAAVLADYEDRAGEAQITPRSTRNLSNGLVTQSFGGYMDATGNPVTFNIVRNRDGAIVRAFTQDSLGKRKPVAKDFDPNTPDATIAHEVAKDNEWTRGDRKQIVAAANEAKNELLNALVGKADSVRLENGLPRLDDQTAMELASEVSDIIDKHTFETGVAPQLGGRLSQAVARYAKQSPAEVKRGAVEAQKEEAAGFALEPQTEAKLAEKVAAEEGAGKTNRIDTVSQRLQEALDTKPTGAVRSVLEEAKRVVDSDKAPKTLLDEAEAQALRIINGKTPQLRTLYDETVIAKEGRVTEETQQHFPQFAQRGTIRGTSEKFQRFLASPRMTFKREEYIRARKAYAAMLEEIKSLMDVGYKKEYADLERKLNGLVDRLKRGDDVSQEVRTLIRNNLKDNPDYQRAMHSVAKAQKEWEGTVALLRDRYAEESKRAEELKAIETHWHSAIDPDIKKKNPNKYPRNAFGLQEAYDDKLVSRTEYRKAKAAMEEAEGISAYLQEISSLQSAAKKVYDDVRNVAAGYLRDATQAAEGSKFIKQLKAERDKLPAKIAKQEAALKALAARVPTALEGQAAFVQERARREEALAKERAALRNAQRAQAEIDSAVKEAKETALRDKREAEKQIAKFNAMLPTISVRNVEERISAGDIRQLKKERTGVIKDMKRAEKGLQKFPEDEEFRSNYATAKERLTQINRQLADWQRKGAQVLGQPVGATYYSREVTQKEGMSAETRADIEREQRKESLASSREAYAKRKQLIAEGKSTSVIGLRNEIEKLNARLAEKNEKGKNTISGSARIAMTNKRKRLDTKLAKLLEADKTLLSKAKYEKAPGNIIKPVEVVPSKKVAGTNIAKVEEEARAEKEAEFREDEGAMEDLAFAQATLLREAGPRPAEEQQVDLNEAKKRADAISAKLAKSGIKMEYYRSIQDAPAKVQAALKYHNETGAKGMIFPDGTVAVFGDMHTSMMDLEQTIAHEVIGHYGVEGALGAKGIQALTDKIFESDGLVYRVAEALGVWGEVHSTEQSAIARGLSVNEQRLAMVRELIAHTAEKRGVPSGLVDTLKRWVKLVVNAVRNMFANNGMTDLTKATTKEIQKLIDTAERQYIENKLPAYQKPNGEVAFRSQAKYKAGFNPKLQKLGDKLIAKDKTWLDKAKANLFGLNFAMQFVDRWAGLEHILDTKMKDSLAAMQVMYNVRGYDARNQLVAETATRGARTIIEKKTKDGKTTRMIGSAGTPGLIDVAQEVGKSKRIGNADAALKQFGLYLTAHRAKRVGIETAFGRNSGVTEADLDSIIREGDSDPHFKKARQLYADYNRGNINFLAKSGAISQAEADELNRYGDYVGFYREKDGFIVDGEHAIKIGSLKENKQLKELLGSDKAIVDFQTSSLQNTALITEIAMRNMAVKSVVNALQDVNLTVVRKGPGPAGANVVRFKDNGKWYHAIIDTDAAGVPTDLFIKGIEGVATTLPAAIRFMQGPANLLRKGVTRMPLYAPRQIIRDSMTSVMANGVDAVPVVSALKSMWDTKAERALQEQGWLGGQTFSHTPDDMKRIMTEIASGGKGWATAMAKLDHLAIKADAASRITAYNSYIKQGFSEMEASLMAAETINFTKRGISPGLNMLSIMIPFFNAQVQGLNVLYRSFTGKGGINQRLNTQAKLFKRGAIMAAATMAYAAFMADDEAYKNATEEERYNNWFFYTPFFDEPLRIPVPFELGYIFKSLPEAVVNVAMGDTKAKDALQGMNALMVRSVPGVTNAFLPQMIKPAIEAYTNYNFFTGKPIESSRMLAIEPGKRRGDTTSGLAASLGDAMGVSPVMIDHLIYGYTGGLGAALTAVLNPVVGPAKAPAAETPMSKMPFIGSAFQPTDGRGIINNARETMDRLLEVKNTAKRLVEEGNVKEAEVYVKENAKALELAKPAEEYKKRMTALAKQLRAVQLSADMTPKEKGEAVKEIRQEQIALSKQLRSVE